MTQISSNSFETFLTFSADRKAKTNLPNDTF